MTIFRKAALERLSQPEQLDQLLEITKPRSWIVLVVLLLLVATLAGWGLIGRVTTRVAAQGILLGGGVSDVVPLTSGAVSRLLVNVGDRVEAGEVVAELAQPELERQLSDARVRLVQLEAEHRQIASFGSQDLRLQEGLIERQRETLAAQIRSAGERSAYLERQMESEETLLQQGLITRRQLEATRQEWTNTTAEIARAEAELASLSQQELTVQFDRRQQLELAEQRIEDAERLIAQLEDELSLRSRVRAPVAGNVLEVMVDEGALAYPGAPILKVGRDDGLGEVAMRAVLYVSTGDGKRIVPGMEVRIAPGTVKPEEHGFIVGRVVRVSEFPATTQGMMHVLKNDQLVARLAAGGAPFEVVATLDEDPEAPSGFAWTSRGGPDVSVQGGTPAAAWIQVESRRPAALVIPALRRFLIATPPTLDAGGAR